MIRLLFLVPAFVLADSAVRNPFSHTARSVESPEIRIFYGA
jgi:hypothetical protein